MVRIEKDTDGTAVLLRNGEYVGLKDSDGFYHSDIWASRFRYSFDLTPKYLRALKRLGIVPDYIPIEILIQEGKFTVGIYGQICAILYNGIPVLKCKVDKHHRQHARTPLANQLKNF